MSDDVEILKCCICTQPIRIYPKRRKKVIEATKVNGDGPYCNLCLHFEMASRYAAARGYVSLPHAVRDFVRKKETRIYATS